MIKFIDDVDVFTVEVTCDVCGKKESDSGAVEVTEDEVEETLRRNGWGVSPGEVHMCPDCKKGLE